MPQYLWRCLECQLEVEVERPIRDSGNPPEAHDCVPRWERLLSPTSFVLKGGGWYANGYSKDKKK